MDKSHDLKKEAVKFQVVGAALLIFTIITVVVAKLHFGLTIGLIIALAIALFKGSLVAGFFMHLLHEKKAVLVIIGFVLFFFLAMILLIYAGQYDLYEGMHYLPNKASKEELHQPASTSSPEAVEDTAPQGGH